MASQTNKVRPSGWWYALVPIIILAGIGFGIYGAVDQGRSIVDSFSRTGSDGTTTIELEAGEKASVFALWSDGRSTSTLERPPADVKVTGPGGADVEFDVAGSSSQSTFDLGEDAGIDLGSFTAPSEGEYEVEVAFDLGSPSGLGVPDAAVGTLDFGELASRALRPMGLGVLAAIGLWILLAVLRGASKRRTRSRPQYVGAPTDIGSTSSGPFVS